MNKEIEKIYKMKIFRDIMQKITTKQTLSYQEKKYILAAALLLLKFYYKDKRHIVFFKMAYYIILNYSIQYKDYKPLYDLSVDVGFFPIAKYILDYSLVDIKIKDIFIQEELNLFQKDDYIQTLEQYNISKQILSNKTQEFAFIAPTSYGKSSIMVDIVKQNNEAKIGIIVPTKSLIAQTFDLIKKANLNKKIILHNDMFREENSFIAIFTQERALEFFKHQKIFFDALFIDEAHNLFESDDRNILLSRVIKQNYKNNQQGKIIYLSPFIHDAENLKIFDTQNIKQYKINFNIKEPQIIERTKDGKIKKYNRFADEFYELNNEKETPKDFFEYIIQENGAKKFIYLMRPVKIEEFARKMIERLETMSYKEIPHIKEILKKHIHPDFYGIKTIDKGLIYLHGKLPSNIKEYLEYKFKNTPSIKYIVANKVILEGINLPIDSLFVMNTLKLNPKKLKNLIGRVNRLNDIFLSNNLEKLLPCIYFIDSDEYQGKRTMENCIKYLGIKQKNKDEIENPILSMYNKKDKKKQNIIDNEKFLEKEPQDEFEKLKQYLIDSGINNFYKSNSIDDMARKLLECIKQEKIDGLSLTEKVYNIFIKDIQDNHFGDIEIRRLKNEKARNFYNSFIGNRHKSFRERIDLFVDYFARRQKSSNAQERIVYIGREFGEIPYPETPRGQQLWIDLKGKSVVELVNLAIIKLQIEESFIDFKFNKFVKMLFEYDLLTEQEYNIHIYGIGDVKYIDFYKLGLHPYLVGKIKNENQIDNIKINNYGFIEIVNPSFDSFLSKLDDFERFQIEKIISQSN